MIKELRMILIIWRAYRAAKREIWAQQGMQAAEYTIPYGLHKELLDVLQFTPQCVAVFAYLLTAAHICGQYMESHREHSRTKA